MTINLKNLIIVSGNHRNNRSRWGGEFNNKEYILMQNVIAQQTNEQLGIDDLMWLKQLKKKNTPLTVEYYVRFGAGRRFDVVNTIKTTEDATMKAINNMRGLVDKTLKAKALINDRQFINMHTYLRGSKTNEYDEVKIVITENKADFFGDF